MKYLKKYENINKYKDGDIVVLDLWTMRNKYVKTKNKVALNFLSLLESPVQQLHICLEGYNTFLNYYIKHKLWHNSAVNDKFFIKSDEISRKANSREIEEFKMREKINKFNV